MDNDQAALYRHCHRDRRTGLVRPHPSQRRLGERRPLGAERLWAVTGASLERRHLMHQVSPPAMPPAFGGALDFRRQAAQEGCHQSPHHRRRIDRTARRRRLWPGGEAARRRFDFAASGACGARQGSARGDLPVFARHARQRRCAGRGEGRLEYDPEKWKSVLRKRSCSTAKVRAPIDLI